MVVAVVVSEQLLGFSQRMDGHKKKTNHAHLLSRMDPWPLGSRHWHPFFLDHGESGCNGCMLRIVGPAAIQAVHTLGQSLFVISLT